MMCFTKRNPANILDVLVGIPLLVELKVQLLLVRDSYPFYTHIALSKLSCQIVYILHLNIVNEKSFILLNHVTYYP